MVCAFPNEPDGFRGLSWGTEISSLSGFTKVGVDPGYGGIDLYVRGGDELVIGAAKLDKIIYGFWRGKFCNATGYFSGYRNFLFLKHAIETKFYQGSRPNQFLDDYVWLGGITQIFLHYREVNKKGFFQFISRKVLNEMEDYAAQKAKDGAAKGF